MVYSDTDKLPGHYNNCIDNDEAEQVKMHLIINSKYKISRIIYIRGPFILHGY